MRLQILIGLILCNLVWAAHPLMGKLVLEDFSPSEAAWLRYASALVTYFLARILFGSFFKNKDSIPNVRRFQDWMLLIFLGGMAFCFSPLLQLTGLQASRATDNALIVAMEPLMTVALAWLVLKQSISRTYFFSFIFALLGFLLLTGLSMKGFEIDRSHLLGNFVILVSLLGEASYSVAGAKLLERESPFSIFGWAIFFGVILLTAAVGLISHEAPWQIVAHASQHIHWRSALGLLWMGPMGTTASYLYWMFALRETRVSSLALTLFIQPVFGAVLGFLFLDERLTLLQAIGGMLILTAVFSQSVSSAIRERKTYSFLGRQLRR